MPHTLERIRDRTTSPAALLSAIAALGDAGEPASFWLAIAEDPSYRAIHRAVALCQFFKRHITTPLSIAELATLLKHAEWIATGTVSEVRHLKGEIPVQWNLGEGVLAIRAFTPVDGAPVLYLRLERPIESDAFVRLMRGASDVRGGETRILEAACSESVSG